MARPRLYHVLTVPRHGVRLRRLTRPLTVRRPGSQRQQRHEWSSYAPSQVDSGLVANIQKLFSERIEIFAPVEFSKVSILTGIIKISLKVSVTALVVGC